MTPVGGGAAKSGSCRGSSSGGKIRQKAHDRTKKWLSWRRQGANNREIAERAGVSVEVVRTALRRSQVARFPDLEHIPAPYMHGAGRREARLGKRHYRVEDRGYETPCWIWLLNKQHNGYGRVWVERQGRPAHRFYYEQKYGPVPKDLETDHLCQVRECVNPDHIEPVTRVEHGRRRKNARRA